MSETVPSPEQQVQVLKARTKAFRFVRGRSGNPTGQSRFYHEARKLARRAAPEMMKELIELARSAEDERVRSVCAVAVLDRAGVKPIDYDPAAEKKTPPSFNPDDYSTEELEQIEVALRLIVDRNKKSALSARFVDPYAV